MGCPLPLYIKEGGRRRSARGGGAPRGGNPTPSRFRPPPTPFPIPTRRRGKEEVERRKERGAPSPPLVQFGLGQGGSHLLVGPLSSPLRPMRPNSFPGVVPVTPGTPVLSETYPEHFQCPNNMVQYINLYVSTISRLIVMSVISSGTLNNLRYIKSHKLIIPIVIER